MTTWCLNTPAPTRVPCAVEASKSSPGMAIRAASQPLCKSSFTSSQVSRNRSYRRWSLSQTHTLYGSRSSVPVGYKQILCHSSTGKGTAGHGSDEECVTVPSLKEWALACAALREGDQTVLLRKGGLKDPQFSPRASSFVLFPTAFHNTSQLVNQTAASKYSEYLDFELGEVVDVEVIASLTGCWKTMDPSVLQLTSDFHVWSEGLLSTRMKWKPKQPLTVMELRCWNLPSPLRIPMIADYKGCFSWVDLQTGVGISELLKDAHPAISDEEFETRQKTLREQLALLSNLEELPIVP